MLILWFHLQAEIDFLEYGSPENIQEAQHAERNELINIYWKCRVVIMPTLPSLPALQFVIMTNCSATSDDKFGICSVTLIVP